MGLKLNPWQRFAAALASVVCLWSALAAFRDDGRIGLPFLGGAMLMLLALSRPHDGEPWFPPFGSYGRRAGGFISRHWIGTVLIAVVLCASFAIKAYRQNQIVEQQQAEQRLADAQRVDRQKQQVAKAEANYRACIAKVHRTNRKSDQYAYLYASTAEAECKSERERARNPVQETFDAIRNSNDQAPIR